MTDSRSSPSLDARDFDAIEAAVMETERGRWFLAEYSKRNRLGETRVLLDAITRLEQNVAGPRPADETDLVRSELTAMRAALATAAAGLGGGEPAAALEGFAGAVRTMESASTDIHGAAERVNEAAWRLRGWGGPAALCDELERAAAEISTACAFGGLTAARAGLLVDALRTIGERLDALPPAWRPVSSPPPVVADSVPRGAPTAKPVQEPLDMPIVPETAAPVPVRSPKAPRQDPARDGPSAPPRAARGTMSMPVSSLAAIAELDFRERLKLFT
jgi:hypothetical protein